LTWIKNADEKILQGLKMLMENFTGTKNVDGLLGGYVKGVNQKKNLQR